MGGFTELAYDLKKHGAPNILSYGWLSAHGFDRMAALHNVAIATYGNGVDHENAVIQMQKPFFHDQLSYLKELYDQKAFSFTDGDNAEQSFADGETLFITQGANRVLNLKKLVNNRFEIDVASFPYWEKYTDVPQGTCSGSTALWVLAGHEKDHAAIADFLQYLISFDAQKELIKQTGYLPVINNLAAIKEQLLQEKFHKTLQGKACLVALTLFDQGTNKTNTRGILLPQFWDIRQIQIDQMTKAIKGEISIEQALATIDNEANIILKQNKGDSEKMKQKKVLVTGAGTGIGREIALEFARQGADVVLHYFHPDEKKGAQSALAEIQAMGRRATLFKADFNNIKAVLKLGKFAVTFLNGIDCLVNNAGITFNKPFSKVTTKQFDVLYNVNVKGPFFLTQYVVRFMEKAGGGAICNISSMHGIQGAPEYVVYAGTKGAIIAQTSVLAVELAHKGIRVNAIAPGYIPVERYFKADPHFSLEEAKKFAFEKIPTGYYGLPIDIAKLAVFLCSEDARFIIGQNIAVDGGTTRLMSSRPDFRKESRIHNGIGYVPGA
jgi:3-oxoacyl-[acyl-carrier protein] reductase